jgi:hypothetical protein
MELRKYKLDLVGIQEFRWDKGDTERAENFTFFYGAGMNIISLGRFFFVHKRIISAVRRVKFVSRRMSYIILLVAGAILLLLMCTPHVRIRAMM